MSRRVLIIVDFFNPEGFSETPGLAGAALAAARHTAALKVRLRRARVPVIYANDNFGQWQSNFSTLVSICKGLSGESGQIAKLLAPGLEIGRFSSRATRRFTGRRWTSCSTNSVRAVLS